MDEKIACAKPEDMANVSQHLLSECGDDRVFAFYGDLGAGKTTLIKQICADLRVLDKVSSPTFALVNEYQTKEGEPVYHFDFYRIKNLAEAADIGFSEYLDSGSYCFIEWAENVEGLLPEDCVKVYITVDGIERLVKISKKTKTLHQ